MAYSPRIVDQELQYRLSLMGAVLIEDPKVVGKTETALEIAQSVVRLDIDHVARTLAQTDPTLLFAGEVPRLIDEWQLEVGIWPHLRLELTERKVPGQFILTGSSVPDDDKMRDTGAGRIMRMKMRPMTLLETGHSEGTVSLSSLFAQNFTTVPAPTLTLQEVTDRVCVGGWPLFYKLPLVDAQTAMISYLSDIAGLDVQRVSGVNYHKDNVLKVLQSLARNVGTKGFNLASSAIDERVSTHGEQVIIFVLICNPQNLSLWRERDRLQAIKRFDETFWVMVIKSLNLIYPG